MWGDLVDFGVRELIIVKVPPMWADVLCPASWGCSEERTGSGCCCIVVITHVLSTLYAAASMDTQEASSPGGSGEDMLLVMSTKCSGLTRRQEGAHWWHVDSLYCRNVSCRPTEHCRLYNVQETDCLALNIVLSICYSTDWSIDVDCLQVHINKEQEWQYHRPCLHAFQ